MLSNRLHFRLPVCTTDHASTVSLLIVAVSKAEVTASFDPFVPSSHDNLSPSAIGVLSLPLVKQLSGTLARVYGRT